MTKCAVVCHQFAVPKHPNSVGLCLPFPIQQLSDGQATHRTPVLFFGKQFVLLVDFAADHLDLKTNKEVTSLRYMLVNGYILQLQNKNNFS